MTHQLQFLKRADKVVIIQEGSAVASGTFDKLMASGVDFLSFMANDKPKTTFSKSRSRSIASRSRSIASCSTLSQINEDAVNNEDNHEEEAKRGEATLDGAVKFQVYWDYVRSGASIPFFVFAVIITLGSQGIYHYTDFWLAAWTEEYKSVNFSNDSMINGNETFVDKQATFETEQTNVLIYCGLTLVLFILAFARSMSFFVLCLNCSIQLHNLIFSKLLRAPLSFFETNPLGRILNRFTRDVGFIDQRIPPMLVELILVIH